MWVDIEPLLVSNKTPWLARQSPEGSLRKACKEKRKNRFFKTYTTKIQFILLGQPKQATGNGRTLDLILLIIEVKVPLGKNGVILMGLSLTQCMEKMREESFQSRKKTGQTGNDLKYFIATTVWFIQCSLPWKIQALLQLVLLSSNQFMNLCFSKLELCLYKTGVSGPCDR